MDETAPSAEPEYKKRGAQRGAGSNSSSKKSKREIQPPQVQHQHQNQQDSGAGQPQERSVSPNCEIDSWDSNDDMMMMHTTSYMSTRESVIRSEADRAGAELAGLATTLLKEKTGYQLFHMHRVAEIKRDLGVKHHDAFKRAAKDWSRLPESEKEWYNSRADKKPLGRPVKLQGREDALAHHVVATAVAHSLFDADVHPPPMVAVRRGGGGGGGGGGGEVDEAATGEAAPASVSEHASPPPIHGHDGSMWSCQMCGIADAGAPGGVCLMCAAFGTGGLM